MKPDFEFTREQQSKLDSSQQESIQNKHILIREFASLCKESAEIEKELTQSKALKTYKTNQTCIKN